MPADLVIRSTRIVADGAVRPGAIFVRGEKIESVVFEDQATPQPSRDAHVLDVGDLVVMPGLVDTHVHVNEPGRADWEGFVTAGRAAAAGGITTIVVMPLNCTPSATSAPALLAEAQVAAGKCLVDYGLWGGLVPGNIADLEPMWSAGALGFKAFMVPSGVDDFGAVTERELEDAFPTLGHLGAPLLLHAEDAPTIKDAQPYLERRPSKYAAYLASRPVEAEIEAVRMVLHLMRQHRSQCPHCHIVHVSSDRVAFEVAQGKSEGLPITAETCPHYFTFEARSIRDGQTQFKCAPPIRHRYETAWEDLHDGPLDLIASDHSPCPPELKVLDSGSFLHAWGGISSLQLLLPASWSSMRKTAYVDLGALNSWLSAAPARLAGIEGRKGHIAAGYDADLIIFDPDDEWTVRAEALHHRHKLTPYDGMTLRGVVKRTILRGRTIYDAAASNPFPSEPIGQWIKRGST